MARRALSTMPPALYQSRLLAMDRANGYLASMPGTARACEGLASTILEMSGPTTLSAACSRGKKTLRFKDDGGFAKRGDRCLV